MKHPLFFLLLACGLLTSACDAEPPVRLGIGQKPPAFELTDTTGKNHRFPEDFKGRGVILRFWADWCPYCKSEMTAIQEVYRERSFSILAINVAQSAQTARNFLKGIGATYPAPLDLEGETARAYGVTGLPTSFVINDQGRIVGKIIGEMDRELFLKKIEPILQ